MCVFHCFEQKENTQHFKPLMKKFSHEKCVAHLLPPHNVSKVPFFWNTLEVSRFSCRCGIKFSLLEATNLVKLLNAEENKSLKCINDVIYQVMTQ